MHRNLDRRVEVLVQLSEPDHITELGDLFDLGFRRRHRVVVAAAGRYLAWRA